MSRLDNILRVLDDVEFVQLNDYEDAVIGVDLQRNLLVYSQKRIVSLLMERHHIDYDEALKVLASKLATFQFREDTPIIVDDDWYI